MNWGKINNFIIIWFGMMNTMVVVVKDEKLWAIFWAFMVTMAICARADGHLEKKEKDHHAL